MRKLSLLAISIFAVACTQTKPALQSTRWNGQGERPNLFTKSITVTDPPIWASANEDVQIANQTISKYKVEGSFLKKIHKKNKGLIFESSNLILNIPKSIVHDADQLEENKAKSWILFTQKNPDYKNYKVISDIEVRIQTIPKIKPVINVLVDTFKGEIISLTFTGKGELLDSKKMGSNLTDVTETVSLGFPKGPKKSDLTSILLLKKNQPEGLATSFLEVLTESPIKITNTQSLEYPPTDERFDQVQAFYFSQQILTWFEETLLLKGPVKLTILTNVGYPDKINAAFYFQNQIRLGAGDDITFSKISWDPSIVMHETSHSVIDVLSHLPFQGEGGSINEGFADLFTTFYLNSPLLGENSYKKADYKRTVDIHMKLSEKTGGLYHDSAIVSGFFWSLKNLIGREKTLNLAIHVLNRLGPSTDFSDFILSLNEQTNELLKDDDLKKTLTLMKEHELL